MGYGLIEQRSEAYGYITSGIVGRSRAKDPNTKKFTESYQDYRRWLVAYMAREVWPLFATFQPDLIVTEIQPAGIGSALPGGSSQSELAKAAWGAIETLAFYHGLPMQWYAANTIKERLTGAGDASKVAVRNVVIDTFPVLQPRKKELTAVADESDALGIALVGAGFRCEKPRKPSKRTGRSGRQVTHPSIHPATLP